jgi:hypothetical protein
MNRAQRRAKTHEKRPARDFVIDYSWRMILAAAGIVLSRRGMDEDTIADIMIEIQAVIDAEVDAGGDAATMIQRLEDETGIQLQRRTI